MKRTNKLVSLVVIMLMTLLALNALAPTLAAPPMFQDDFETGNLRSWSTAGSVSTVTSPVNSGSYAAKAVGTNAYWSKNLGSGYNDIFFAGYVMIASMPTSGQSTLLLKIYDRSYISVVAGGLQVSSGGKNYWCLIVNGNWYYPSSSSNIQASRWYFMEIEYNTAGTANLWIDGNLIVSISRLTLSKAQILQAGNPFSYTPSGFISYGDNYAAATNYISPTASTSSSSTQVSTQTVPTASSSPTPTPTPTPVPTATATPTPTVTPSSTQTSTTATTTNGIPWLHTSGQNIYDSSGKQVILKTCNIHYGGGQSITSTDIQKIKNMGFNSIRIHIYWDLIQPSGPTSVNTAIFTQTSSPAGTSIDNIVNWCAQNGLYLILNPSFTGTSHSPPSWTGMTNNDAGVTKMLGSSSIMAGVNYMYGWMAQHYADKSNVIFESFNEMAVRDSSLGGKPFADFNHGWVSAIEQGEGGNSHLKIIEWLMINPAYDEILTPPYISGTHGNILLASHDYTPMSSGSWTGNTKDVINNLARTANAAHAVNLPVIDTEFAKSITQSQWQLWLQTEMTYFKQNNYAGWAYWCYCSTSSDEASGEAAWNLNNPSIASQVLPILQSYM